MSHDSHGHHHHDHGTSQVSDRVLLWTVVANIGLSVFEFLAGVIAGSVALMADALHNANDAGALLIAYIARKVSRRGSDGQFTFGYRRAELIGAMIQLTALIIVGLFLFYEAVRRFFEPEPLKGAWIMGAAGVAILVDLATAWLLWAMSKGSLNLRAAFLHNITDAVASFAVLAGGAAIYWLEWTWVDPTLTILISGAILYLSYGMIRRTIGILMEGTPPGLKLEDISTEVLAIEGVVNLHHLHVWELDEAHRALEAHLVVQSGLSPKATEEVKVQVKALLGSRFSIGHSTLEIETEDHGCDRGDWDLFPSHS